jgi:hypothetical protein
MKIKHSVLTVTALAVGVLALGAGRAAAQTSGTITNDGISMPVKAALAVVQPNGLNVSFLLLPFVPTPDEVTALRKGKTETLMVRPSGEPKKWPRGTPYVEVTLTWQHNPAGLGKLDQAFFTNLHGYYVAPTPTGQFVAELPGKKGKATLEGEVKAGATLTLTASGFDGPEVNPKKDSKVVWDFKAAAPIVTALPR